MPAIVLQQVSSPFARKNARGTLEKPVALKYLARYLDAEIAKDLAQACSDGTARIWGAKEERSHQFFKMPARNSIVLFRRGPIVFAHGAIAATTTNEALAEYL